MTPEARHAGRAEGFFGFRALGFRVLGFIGPRVFRGSGPGLGDWGVAVCPGLGSRNSRCLGRPMRSEAGPRRDRRVPFIQRLGVKSMGPSQCS